MQCQFYSEQMPIELKIANRRFNFLKKISSVDSIYCKYFDINNDELFLLVNKYCYINDVHMNMVNDRNKLKNINFNASLRKYFELSVEHLI